MEEDPRKCPHCGHGVLDWDTLCPGCDQIPWNTAAGMRIFRGRRRRHFWLTGGPIIALLVVAAGFVIVTNLGLMQRVDITQEQADLGRIFDEAVRLRHLLEHAEPGSLAHDEVRAATLGWLGEELPTVLVLVQDHEAYGPFRSDAIVTLGVLLGGPSRFSTLAAGHRPHVIQVFRTVAAEEDRMTRTAAVMALEAMGADEALR